MSRPSSSTYQAVYARDDNNCQRCGVYARDGHGQVQHRLPRGRGGDHRLSNLVLMCGTSTSGCHGWAETQRSAAKNAGWLVPTEVGGIDGRVMLPTILLIRLDGSTFLIDDDGGRVEL